MIKNETTNSFQGGLLMDRHPLLLPNTTYNYALNATITTNNGNEGMLLNDMGNTKLPFATLSEGYTPIGSCEFGGIIYIVSVKEEKDSEGNSKYVSEIGSFPGPKVFTVSEKGNELYVEFSDEDFSNGELSFRKVTLTSVLKKFDKVLNPGDSYVLMYKASEDIPENLITYQPVSVSENNDVTVLEYGLGYDVTFDNIELDFDSKSVMFSSKTAGTLAIQGILNIPQTVNMVYNVTPNKADDGSISYLLSITVTNTDSVELLSGATFGVICNDVMTDASTDGKVDLVVESKSGIQTYKPYFKYEDWVYEYPDTSITIDWGSINTGTYSSSNYQYYIYDDRVLLDFTLNLNPYFEFPVTGIDIEIYDLDGKTGVYKIEDLEAYSGDYSIYLPLNNSYIEPLLEAVDHRGEKYNPITGKNNEYLIYNDFSDTTDDIYIKQGSLYIRTTNEDGTTSDTALETPSTPLYLNDRGVIYSNNCYILKIIVRTDSGDYTFNPYVLWTTGFFNDEYGSGADFNTLTPTLNVVTNLSEDSTSSRTTNKETITDDELTTITSTDTYKLKLNLSDSLENDYDDLFSIESGNHKLWNVAHEEETANPISDLTPTDSDGNDYNSNIVELPKFTITTSTSIYPESELETELDAYTNNDGNTVVLNGYYLIEESSLETTLVVTSVSYNKEITSSTTRTVTTIHPLLNKDSLESYGLQLYGGAALLNQYLDIINLDMDAKGTTTCCRALVRNSDFVIDGDIYVTDTMPTARWASNVPTVKDVRAFSMYGRTPGKSLNNYIKELPKTINGEEIKWYEEDTDGSWDMSTWKSGSSVLNQFCLIRIVSPKENFPLIYGIYSEDVDLSVNDHFVVSRADNTYYKANLSLYSSGSSTYTYGFLGMKDLNNRIHLTNTLYMLGVSNVGDDVANILANIYTCTQSDVSRLNVLKQVYYDSVQHTFTRDIIIEPEATIQIKNQSVDKFVENILTQAGYDTELNIEALNITPNNQKSISSLAFAKESDIPDTEEDEYNVIVEALDLVYKVNAEINPGSLYTFSYGAIAELEDGAEVPQYKSFEISDGQLSAQLTGKTIMLPYAKSIFIYKGKMLSLSNTTYDNSESHFAVVQVNKSISDLATGGIVDCRTIELLIEGRQYSQGTNIGTHTNTYE